MCSIKSDVLDALRDIEAALAAQSALLQALAVHVFRDDAPGCRAVISDLLLSATFSPMINWTEDRGDLGQEDGEAFRRRCVLAFRPLFEGVLRQVCSDGQEAQ